MSAAPSKPQLATPVRAALVTGRVKGAFVGQFLDWYRLELGEPELLARFGQVIESGAIPELDVTRPACGILASGWYDAIDIHSMLDALGDGRSEQDIDDIVRRGTRSALTSTFSGVHRALIRAIGTPQLHSRFAQQLWSTYYDNGTARSFLARPGEQEIAYTNWASHHPLLCKINAISDELIFPMMGLNGVRVEMIECVAEGGARCAHVVQWTR